MVHRIEVKPNAITTELDRAYVYVDIEVNPSSDRIYRMGLVAMPDTFDYPEHHLHDGYAALVALRSNQVRVCGHNFRRFDQKYLATQRPELANWDIIDTLELSLLAYPLQASHRLSKDYKLSQYAANNPLEDARATRLLLLQVVEDLDKLPPPLLQFYIWLLTCSATNEPEDRAYRHFFGTVLGKTLRLAPPLPLDMQAGLDSSILRQMVKQAPQLPFTTRLCLAALLAWNEARTRQKVDTTYPSWLGHQSEYLDLLRLLRPLQPEGVTFHKYLHYFGRDTFRPAQEDAIRSILAGERPLVVMPTGSGKSLCFQVPALMLHTQQVALSVVISPLQALMADQVDDLETARLDFATFINANLPSQERQQRLQQLREGKKGLLYISPEQLRSISVRMLLRERPPALWVVDEAHCISQWGHDFRPDYMYIPKFMRELTEERGADSPLIALMTATATRDVVRDIKEIFESEGLRIGRIIESGGTQRENLRYIVVPPSESKDQALVDAVHNAQRGNNGAILVYTTTRKRAQSLAGRLTNIGIPSRYYHSKLGREDKRDVLTQFKEGTLNVVVATRAFGMGINRHDVRAVIHHTMSANLEGYIQETGRAGRDGQPAVCTLLFDEHDADTIFRLQARNHLSDADLRSIFLAARAVRNRALGSASEDWFWATTSDLSLEATFAGEFAAEQDQRDTKIKVALHYLERFGMVERAENMSTYIQFDLTDTHTEDSLRRFQQYSATHDISQRQQQQFERLIHALHVVCANAAQGGESYPLDVISDEAGIDPKELAARIQELQAAGVCSIEIPLTLLVTKDVAGAARPNHERIRTVERDLLALIREVQASDLDETGELQLHVPGLVTMLDPDGTRKITSRIVFGILDGWAAQNWVALRPVNPNIVRLAQITVDNHLDAHRARTGGVIELLYARLGVLTGARLPVPYELGELLRSLNQQIYPLATSTEELEDVLLWLHQQKLLILRDGLSLFRQALKLRVIPRANVATVTRRYSEVKAYYDEQTRRTHVMIHYGQLPTREARERLINDYFQLEQADFAAAYPWSADESATRPVTQEDYARIMGSLNPAQRDVVLDEHPALAVIAGPGSGKTRTIVHRIAYLVKVQGVDPACILVLAYNRSAVRDLRIRLQHLIGPSAARLRVHTFHGLALALLGRTVGRDRRATVDFDGMLEQACDLLERGDELDDQDVQARRLQLIGNVEHIFVDEYQDVDARMYRLIKLVAGLGDAEDDTRSVQINLCVIGDDDQAIYEFRQADARYIQSFEAEYRAKRLLLTENYRSTEPIIAAANALIQHNSVRCKQAPGEQVRIDSARLGSSGLPVQAVIASDLSAQAIWIRWLIQQWIVKDVSPREIAVLSRTWDRLAPARLMLETAGIATQTLNANTHAFTRNLAVCQVLEQLTADRSRIIGPGHSAREFFYSLLAQLGHDHTEPTVKALLKIAEDLDRERGIGDDDLALPITCEELATAIHEFAASHNDILLDEQAVLTTSCHSAKGLEFRKVILLTDDFMTAAHLVEQERRLFYVGMTRAKEELVLCGTDTGQFLNEIGVQLTHMAAPSGPLPARMLYHDLTPAHIWLGHNDTVAQQETIRALHEGMPLQLMPYGSPIGAETGWEIQTATGTRIGALSQKANALLAEKGVRPGQFEFKTGEVTVHSIYRQLGVDQVTGKVNQDHFVVLPQIRVCR